MPDPPRTLEDPDWPLVERWRRAHREQEEVCQEIFERHRRKVAGLFRRKGHPTGNVQDLTQETFLRVFNKLESYRGNTRIEVWIMLIALNVHYSEVRRIRAEKRKGVEIPIEEPEEEPLQIPADVMSPEEELSAKERRVDLRLAIAELPPRRRRCIEMYYSKGFKVREIARELGITPGAVQAHLHQARQQLREILGQHFPDLEIDIEDDHDGKGNDVR